MAAQPKIKTSLSTQRKFSFAAGIISAIAMFISLISPTWGFEGIGKQWVETLLAINTVINMYFLGVTSQKISEEKKNEESN